MAMSVSFRVARVGVVDADYLHPLL